LNNNTPEVTHPVVLQAHRYAADIFLPTALEIVPPYLLLTEANIAVVLFDKVQGHICQAK
jgi:hypothetical protein